MTKQIINIGTSANKGNGDPLRTAFTKVNENFTELYSAIGADVQIPVQTGNIGKYLTTNGATLSWATVDTGGASVTTSATAPVGPVLGDLWYDTASGRTYVYYDSSWVDANPVDGAGISSTNHLVNGSAEVALGSNGVLTFPGAEGFQATFGSVFPVGDVLHSVNNLHLESEQSVTVNSGDQVADLENNYIDYEQQWVDVRDQDAQIIAPATRPWAGMPSYEAYDVLMNYNQNPPGGVLPPASNMAPTAKTASDAYDFWQEELTAVGVNISVAGSKVWNFSGDGSLTFPDNTVQSTAYVAPTTGNATIISDPEGTTVSRNGMTIRVTSAGMIQMSFDNVINVKGRSSINNADSVVIASPNGVTTIGTWYNIGAVLAEGDHLTATIVDESYHHIYRLTAIIIQKTTTPGQEIVVSYAIIEQLQ